VTELHDTVQVIKELYATVLERNTAGAAGASTGSKPARPLELDLRAPVAGAPTAAPARTEAKPQPAAPEKRGLERFTELPTEVGLDLDLSTVARGGVDANSTLNVPPTRAPVSSEAPQQPVETTVPAAAVPAKPDERRPSAAVSQPRTDAASGQGAEFPDEHLTQTPTEVSIDIDVGTATSFPSTSGLSASRFSLPRRAETAPTSGPATALEPIDLQLDLNQPESKTRRRAGR
jgi:hypothetical protein